MLKRPRNVCYALFFWAMAVCSATAGDRCVVLVSVDGLAASYFDDHRAALPQLRALAERGARAEGMVTAFPSVTWTTQRWMIVAHDLTGSAVADVTDWLASGAAAYRLESHSPRASRYTVPF